MKNADSWHDPSVQVTWQAAIISKPLHAFCSQRAGSSPREHDWDGISDWVGSGDEDGAKVGRRNGGIDDCGEDGAGESGMSVVGGNVVSVGISALGLSDVVATGRIEGALVGMTTFSSALSTAPMLVILLI